MPKAKDKCEVSKSYMEPCNSCLKYRPPQKAEKGNKVYECCSNRISSTATWTNAGQQSSDFFNVEKLRQIMFKNGPGRARPLEAARSEKQHRP